MRTWRHLLGGLLLWTVHFFAVYGIASVFPGTSLAVVLVMIASAIGLTIAAWFLVRALVDRRASDDKLQRWLHGLAGLAYALAGVAIIYQGLPAVFS